MHQLALSCLSISFIHSYFSSGSRCISHRLESPLGRIHKPFLWMSLWLKMYSKVAFNFMNHLVWSPFSIHPICLRLSTSANLLMPICICPLLFTWLNTVTFIYFALLYSFINTRPFPGGSVFKGNLKWFCVTRNKSSCMKELIAEKEKSPESESGPSGMQLYYVLGGELWISYT